VKINFVSYLNPFKFSGGGEVVNQRLINVGQERGHEFTFTTAKNRQFNYRDDADFDLLVDIFNFPHTIKSGGNWIRLNKNFIGGIIKNRPFFHLSHSYVDVCNLGYLPCSGKASEPCTDKLNFSVSRSLINREIGNQCFAENQLVRESFTKSISNIFVSPLHLQTTENILNLELESKSIILRPVISVETFRNLGLKRDIENLFVGVISEAKGIENLRARYKNEPIMLAGKLHPGVKLDFGTYLGEVPYSEMPTLMNRAKNFVYLPRWPEPQGRVVVEAALSGCNLVTNEKVGAVSFNFDISNPANLLQVEEEFWEKLEEVFFEKVTKS
jgi:glycosyltransferase involved in cell wall biosynthesis